MAQPATRSASTRLTLAVILGCAIAPLAAAQQAHTPEHLFFRVTLGPQFPHAVSGRLLLFVSPRQGDHAVDVDEMSPDNTYVAAREVPYLAPGQTVEIDADDVVFPGPLSSAARGDYEAQAVLDVDHQYAYAGREPGDLETAVVAIPEWNPAIQPPPQLSLTMTVPLRPDPLRNSPDVLAALETLDFSSAALHRFSGRDIHMRGIVVLPPGYRQHARERYPTVYYTHGFGATLDYLRNLVASDLYRRMKDGKMPEMIWVLLDESCPTGTHEFADSVNNGPWGTALTTELIPYLEDRYRMDARASGRFLQGHSSGGWATLWLQTVYPKIFGGTWSTSPDPSDFHAFCTIDLYAPNANAYHTPDGAAQPVVRNHQAVVETMEQMARMEEVLGPYGGQLASFEWVFSPRGADGRPVPMFNRATGAVDPAVIAYWRDHYDIAHLIESNWQTLGPDLRGKIHLMVGTDDTFYLDRAAHRLQAVLDRLNAHAQFSFLPGRTHFNIYEQDSDRLALLDQIAAEMYAIARPHGKAKTTSHD